MTLWKFFDYVTDNEENLVRVWYEAQDLAVQAQFDATLTLLGGLANWEDDTVEEFKPLVNQHKGLGEIRFHIDERPPGATKAKRRRFRPVGVWPVLRDLEFILILGCEKTRMAYIPAHAFDSALGYKAALLEGNGTIHEHS
jgi:hypothetical protein